MRRHRVSFRTSFPFAVAVALCVTVTSPGFAGPQTTCEEGGMATWVFKSGLQLMGDPPPHQRCQDAWNSFAQARSATASYTFTHQIRPGVVDQWGQPVWIYTCQTCTLGAHTAPSLPTLSVGVGVGDAGDAATGLVPGGAVVNIRRHERFPGTEDAVYAVDVQGV
ncbi:MAG: hypothetical protein AAGF23_09045, partial [Acidobacteriota bacterium]